jgi:hypothetical protein
VGVRDPRRSIVVGVKVLCRPRMSVVRCKLPAMTKVETSSVAAAHAGEHADVRRAVELVGQILASSVSSRSTLDGFLHAKLGRSGSDVVCESRKLSSIGHVTVGLASITVPALREAVRKPAVDVNSQSELSRAVPAFERSPSHSRIS